MAKKTYEPVRIQSYRETLLDGITPCAPSLEMAKTIDWNNSSDRKWFMNHMHWSIMNGRIVTVHPEHTTRSCYRVIESN